MEQKSSYRILISGGGTGGHIFPAILPLVKEKVKAIVAMGLHNEKILQFFGENAPEIPVLDTCSLADAVAGCRRVASDGDTVLLSPCCASFDLFKSYEDRGTQFKEAIKAMC